MPNPRFITRPEVTGTFGAVAATHWIAAQAAMGTLERGGNAFDAAVTGGFVLQMVEPHLNGPGGEVPILFWDERGGGVRALNGQGWAPAAATPATYRRMGFQQVPGIGLLAATVPGAVSTWLTLLREHGTWSLADVLAPAIAYARDGFPASQRLCEAILGVRALFTDEWTSSADVWLDRGRVPLPGSLIRLPGLASTYTRVIEAAQSGGGSRVTTIDAAILIWQEGFVAQEIDAWCRNAGVRDSSGERHGGLLRLEDIAAWRPAFEAPRVGKFGRYQIAKFGFQTQGPMQLQMLSMLEHAELERHAPDSAGFVHRIAEATKAALGDRLGWYGTAPNADGDAQSALLADDYGVMRWAQIHARGRALAEIDVGHPLGRSAVLPDFAVSARSLRHADARFGVGEPTFAALPPVPQWADREIFVGDTCHIDVIDRHGNMVASTPSGGWLSSSPAIPALGFALGTRLQQTWLDDGLASTLTPRVAPCTTLSPSLALRDGEPYLAYGTPGGDQQDQWSTAFFLRHAVHGMNLQEAIDAPGFHVKHGPMSFWPRPVVLNQLHVESRFPDETIAALRDLGHEVQVGEPWSEGRLCACSRSRDRSGALVFRAGATPRGAQAYAVGR